MSTASTSLRATAAAAVVPAVLLVQPQEVTDPEAPMNVTTTTVTTK